MKRNKTVRSLSLLEQSGATARVLNLGAAARRGPPADAEAKPLFHNTQLNRSIILKHRLRRDEQELFGGLRLQATKVVMPIDANDLDVGAQAMFVGQRGYPEMLNSILGVQSRFASHDRMVLQILDECSTLDPFVVRERLRRHGIEPSPHYFEIGAADMSRMYAFVAREIGPLARQSETEAAIPIEGATRLSRKLLSNQADVETEPLRQTLKLDPAEYREGVFCWKAFLYYKWRLEDSREPLRQTMREIAAAQPAFAVIQKELLGLQARLRSLVDAALKSIAADVAVYDMAYANLVRAGDPAPFRQFLLTGPSLFDRLGEGVAALQHLITYWRYRVPGAETTLDPADLREILVEFIQSLHAFEPAGEPTRKGVLL